MSGPVCDPKVFGRKLRTWRLKQHVGQLEMARRLHYTRPYISALEHGRRTPSAKFLELFERVFAVNPALFFALAALGGLLLLCCGICGDVHLSGPPGGAHEPH